MGVLAPAKAARSLDAQHRHARREDRLLVLLVLLLKELPAREANQTNLLTLLFQILDSLLSQLELRAARSQDDSGVVSIANGVSTLGNALDGSAGNIAAALQITRKVTIAESMPTNTTRREKL
eukprot:TRINITY_DN10062_c0_g1_i1.p3 TRINITY_DN10062_c0_g1~~TRINITY_DN10062_c0_g1_i1.p3  ORF type:complete len:123 (-),score=8.26 TRINITY_DN10062_c0_g1_i1:1697-2065(-)